jgi:hypothetical protein
MSGFWWLPVEPNHQVTSSTEIEPLVCGLNRLVQIFHLLKEMVDGSKISDCRGHGRVKVVRGKLVMRCELGGRFGRKDLCCSGLVCLS